VIVALGIAVTAPVPAAAAPAEPVAVIVAPSSSPVFRSPRAAHGLLVVGEGATVSRRGALASLVRGEMGNAIVRGGLPGGKPLITLSRRPARFTFYVELPPPGKHHNVDRYSIAVTGPGYRGVLTDTSTRLGGLISIADVAPSARALARGDRPRIRSESEPDPFAQLTRLDHRLNQAHDARVPATLALVGLILAFSIQALATGGVTAARAAFLAPSACIAAAVALSAAGVVSPWPAVLGVELAGAAGALVGGLVLRPRVPLALALAALFAFLFAVMWAEPAWNALAVIGPHPDGGGRFYGVTNEVETLLLHPRSCSAPSSAPRPCPRSRWWWRPASPRAGSARTAAGSSSSSPVSSSSGSVCDGFPRFEPRRPRPSRPARRCCWSASTQQPEARAT